MEKGHSVEAILINFSKESIIQEMDGGVPDIICMICLSASLEAVIIAAVEL